MGDTDRLLDPARGRRRPLAAALLDGAEWFNTALLSRLEDAGWPALSRNQSRVFPLLGPDGTSQVEVARGLGITRQSAHTLLGQLEALGIVERRPDPTDGRSSIVLLTRRGRALAADAGRILGDLEGELARRLGADHVEALGAALRLDWGDAPVADAQPNPGG